VSATQHDGWVAQGLNGGAATIEHSSPLGEVPRSTGIVSGTETHLHDIGICSTSHHSSSQLLTGFQPPSPFPRVAIMSAPAWIDPDEINVALCIQWIDSWDPIYFLAKGPTGQLVRGGRVSLRQWNRLPIESAVSYVSLQCLLQYPLHLFHQICR
jgi:hypothetical protein